MEIKATEPMRVLTVGRRLAIPGVRPAAAELLPLVEADAAQRGLSVAGPWTFIARNLPKDTRTEFDIRFCLPVSGGDAGKGTFDLETLEPIMVASALYQGPLRSLFTKGYAPLVSEIESSRYVFSGESREVYHQWARDGAGYQRIEIQFGLAR